MIPETGSRIELKRAWFDSLYTPVVGEVYTYHAPMRMYYCVVEVIMKPKVLIFVESYVLYDTDGCFKRAGSKHSFTHREWRMNIRHRQMTYHSATLPPVRGLVI